MTRRKKSENQPPRRTKKKRKRRLPSSRNSEEEKGMTWGGGENSAIMRISKHVFSGKKKTTDRSAGGETAGKGVIKRNIGGTRGLRPGLCNRWFG